MNLTVNAKLVEKITEIRIATQQISEDGQRLDPKTNRTVPPQFLQQLVVKNEEKVLASANLGGGLSHNPGFVFKVKGLKAGAPISVEWVRSQEVLNKDGKRENKEEKGKVETKVMG